MGLKSVSVKIRIPAHTFARLEALAEKRGRDVSDLALVAFLDGAEALLK